MGYFKNDGTEKFHSGPTDSSKIVGMTDSVILSFFLFMLFFHI